MTKKLINESEVLKDKSIDVKSAAVFNKSKQIFPMTENILVREGFTHDEVAAFKPSYKHGDEILFEQADIIIGMTKLHKVETPKKYRAKFITLSEIAVETYIKIPDPFLAKSQSAYDETMAIIKEFLMVFVDKLEKQYINK